MKRPYLIYFLSFVCGTFTVVVPLVVIFEIVNGNSFEGENIEDGVKVACLWLICCLVSWGFWSRISWSRHVVIILAYVLPPLYMVIFDSISIEFFGSILGVLISHWYLFVKRNVVDYFEYDRDALKNDAAKNTHSN